MLTAITLPILVHGLWSPDGFTVDEPLIAELPTLGIDLLSVIVRADALAFAYANARDEKRLVEDCYSVARLTDAIGALELALSAHCVRLSSVHVSFYHQQLTSRDIRYAAYKMRNYLHHRMGLLARTILYLGPMADVVPILSRCRPQEFLGTTHEDLRAAAFFSSRFYTLPFTQLRGASA